MNKLTVLVIFSLVIALASCGHADDHERIDPTTTTGEEGGRPGASDSNDFSTELADDTWRFTLGELALRYDRGGMLFTTLADGTTKITDLNGADIVEFNPELPSLKVNGTTVEIISLSLLKTAPIATPDSTQGTTLTHWYRIATPTTSSCVMVIP